MVVGDAQECGSHFNDVNLVQIGFDPRVILPDFGRGQVDAMQVFRRTNRTRSRAWAIRSGCSIPQMSA